jgi:hypothetical protein
MSRMTTSLPAGGAELDGTLCALDAAVHDENISAESPNAALEAGTHLLDAPRRLVADP